MRFFKFFLMVVGLMIAVGCQRDRARDVHVKVPLPSVELVRGKFTGIDFESRAPLVTVKLGADQFVLDDAPMHLHSGLYGHEVVIVKLSDASYTIKPIAR